MVYGAARSYCGHLPDFKAIEIIYSPKTNLIDVSIYEERRGSFIPLSLQYKYKPTQGYTPIHEIAADRNKRIKQFYWKLSTGSFGMVTMKYSPTSTSGRNLLAQRSQFPLTMSTNSAPLLAIRESFSKQSGIVRYRRRWTLPL